jgi:SAM-dependent methyltransferase
MAARDLVRELCPPALWRALRVTRKAIFRGHAAAHGDGAAQKLDVYWDPAMAEILEHWGEGNAWNEIQLLMASRQGRVLDIACGTGKTMALVGRQPGLEVHGCDISDMLIAKAVERGIAPDRLTVTDATKMSYPDGSFDYAYSIGSLEHFTDDGITRLLSECRRVVTGPTFHMVPVARSGGDEGWITTFQSYHNNSVEWWLAKCRTTYAHAIALDSVWSDAISVGKWLVCSK